MEKSPEYLADTAHESAIGGGDIYQRQPRPRRSIVLPF